MQLNEQLIKDLQTKAKIIRRHIVKMISGAQSGHPGGALSATEIVTSLFWGGIMKYDAKNPTWPDRDRFVLSKGHVCTVLYSALAEAGYFNASCLLDFRHIDSKIQGHPDCVKTAGIEISSGSLGQGLSVANGIALAGKLDKKDYRVYVLLGDGELNEGQVWEAAMSAAHYKLNNLIAIVDRNGLQIDGPTEKVMSLGNLADKWKSFGWNVIETDGHDFMKLLPVFDQAKNNKDKPTAIIANTVKGKGVSYMENMVDFHGKAPSKEQTEQALKELE